MQIEVFTIADAATLSFGKLNMLGSFDHLQARNFPARHEACVIICKLRLFYEDTGKHHLEIKIIDPDGRDVIEPSTNQFGAKIGLDSTGHYTKLWHIRGFPIPKPGTFYIDALVDGEMLSRTPLVITQLTPPDRD